MFNIFSEVPIKTTVKLLVHTQCLKVKTDKTVLVRLWSKLNFYTLLTQCEIAQSHWKEYNSVFNITHTFTV